MSDSDLRIVPIDPSTQIERFIKASWSVFEGDPNWVPPLIFERKEHMDPKKNPFYQIADVRFWIALRGERPVGRVSAQVNRAALDLHKNDAGHFGFFETEDNAETANALMGVVEEWLREKGMKRVQGPYSFSVNDEVGLLVNGFDRPPSLMMGHARPHFAKLLEQTGYQKAADMIAYDFDVTVDGLPDRSRKIAQRLADNERVNIRRLNMRNYIDEVRRVLDIFNDAWSENWGFVPWSNAEMEKLADDLRLIIEPQHVCIIEVDGKSAAFGLTLPNINEAIRDLDGKLLPFGWAKLLYRLKMNKVRSARLPLMGVRKEFQRGWMGAAMSFYIIDFVHQTNKARGRLRGELSWVLEDNAAMRKIIESTGCRPYKTYRVYEKELA